MLLVLLLTAAAVQAKTLLILGDSLSAGYGLSQQQSWVHLLQQKLDQQDSSWTLVNASISGETSGGGLARLPALLEQHKPDYVLIELGANDGYPVAGILLQPLYDGQCHRPYQCHVCHFCLHCYRSRCSANADRIGIRYVQ